MSELHATTGSGWDLRGYASFIRFLDAIGAGSRGAKVLRLPGVVASIAPAIPDRSFFNSVAYEDPAALAAAYDEVRAAYAGAGVNAWTVWVPEHDESSGGMLGGRGHRLDGNPRQMRLDLRAVPKLGEGARTPATRAAWDDLCAINDTAWGHEPGTFSAGLGAKPDASFRAYGAGSGQWTAAVLATLLHEGDCGVYAVATLPEARGRGLAGGLLHRALLDARAQGCESSSLQSSPMGRSVYQRLGYRDLGGLAMWEHRVFAP